MVEDAALPPGGPDPDRVDAEEEQEGGARRLPRPSSVTPTATLPRESRPYHVVRRVTFAATSHRGPLPPAQYLTEINEIVPGGAERIMAMAEKNADHRRQMEAKELDAMIGFNARQQSRSSRGLSAGFLIALAFLAASTYLIHGGHDVAGGVLGTVDLVGLVSVFVIQRIHPGPRPETEDTGDANLDGGSSQNAAAKPPKDPD